MVRCMGQGRRLRLGEPPVLPSEARMMIEVIEGGEGWRAGGVL